MQVEQIHHLLEGLNPISLDGLNRVKLLNRVDRKYIIPIDRLPEILQLLEDNHYAALEIKGRRTFSYQTTYFDTPDFRFYKDHHNRVSSRIKVRTRSYKESNLHFFEIKEKTNVRTKKYRKVLNGPSDSLSDKQNRKIKSIYPRLLEKRLVPTLTNSYSRITLVNKDETERCTIDLNLAYRKPNSSQKEVELNDLVIVEVKQSKTSVLKGIIAALRTMQIHPSGISKYVVGLILTYPGIKYNSFKPLLLKLNKIQSQPIVIS